MSRRAERARPTLPVRQTVAAAARAGRRHVGPILAVAVVVSTVTALMEIVVDDLIDPANVLMSLLVGFGASGVSVLGTVFLSGFLGRMVGEEHGRQSASARQLARALPWGRLIRADLLVVVLVVAGLVLLVIPGLVAMTLLVLAGPVIEIEGRPAWAALRRSAHLVRQRFWTVALLATLPVIVASEIESVGPDPTSAGAILKALAIRGLTAAVLEAAIGLVLVEVCYRLIELDRGAAHTMRS
jgi:UPF0716 family protein affecting phage T7 exclusion